MDLLEWRRRADKQVQVGGLVGAAALVSIAVITRGLLNGTTLPLAVPRLVLLGLVVVVNAIRIVVGFRNGRRLPGDGEYTLPGRWTGLTSRVLTGVLMGFVTFSLMSRILPAPTDLPADGLYQPPGPGEPLIKNPNPIENGTVGRPVLVEDLQFTVTKPPVCTTGPLGSGYEITRPKNGQFCQVTLHIENHGTETSPWQTFLMSAHSARDPSREFTSSLPAELALKTGTDTKLVPGGHWDGSAIYDVPAGERIGFVEFQALTSDGQNARVRF